MKTIRIFDVCPGDLLEKPNGILCLALKWHSPFQPDIERGMFKNVPKDYLKVLEVCNLTTNRIDKLRMWLVNRVPTQRFFSCQRLQNDQNPGPKINWWFKFENHRKIQLWTYFDSDIWLVAPGSKSKEKHTW